MYLFSFFVFNSIHSLVSINSDPIPSAWTHHYDPNYALFSYYIYANLTVLNQLRHAKGYCTFAYRPHAGEAGDVEHLASCFLVARSINHGLVLSKNPSMQYLYDSSLSFSYTTILFDMILCLLLIDII
jgi:adenosine deaminase